MKFRDYINEKVKGKKEFHGTANDKKVMMKQEKNDMYYAEIRDKSDDVESSTTKKTQQQIIKWFDEHGIKKIEWEN